MNRTLDPDRGRRMGTILGFSGLMCITLLALIRALVEHDGFPWWQTDPFVFSPPVIGLTPTLALALNLGVVLCACLTLTGLLLRREPIGLFRAVFLLVGAVFIGVHASRRIETVSEGSNLLAIVSVLMAASCAHRFGGARRIIGAITLSAAVLLVAMGAYEVFVTHPLTVADYERTRELFLGARGWSADSFETLAYERRLYQADPIAWFGLTNVFASFCAAAAAGMGMLLWRKEGEEKSRDWSSGVLALAAILALLGLLMSGAKGGFGALALGVGVTLGARLLKDRIGPGRAIVAACLLVVLGVIARGLIGERLGELSLLFRSQYMLGAARMYLHHPVLGISPGAFQDSYAILKPALSPEDVASAHSFAFDLVATLGIGGVALVSLLVSVLLGIRTPRRQSTREHEILPKRRIAQITLLLGAIGSVVSIRFGSPVMDLDLILVQIGASAVWLVLAMVIVRRASARSLGWALIAAAAVLAIHSMIEVTGTWFVSGLLWALMIGVAAGGDEPAPEKRDSWRVKRFSPLIALLGLLAGATPLAARYPLILGWENELRLAAGPTARFTAIKSSFDELEHASNPMDLRERLASQLSEITGSRVSPSIDQLVNTLNRVEYQWRSVAADHLVAAAAIRPTHTPTAIAASQQLLWRASVLATMNRPDEAAELWDQAIDLLEHQVGVSPSSGGEQWLGSVYLGRAGQFPQDSSRGQWLERARMMLESAEEGSPHNPQLALKLMDLALQQGRDQQAGAWALRAIRLHEQSRLDPLRGLPGADLERARAVVQTGG